jgi:hypothetical protein
MASLRRLIPGLAVVASLLTAGIAPAGQIALNFGSFNTNWSNAQISSALTTQANAAQSGATVSVSGAQVNNNYTGDGHVTGPVIGGNVVPWTLSDTGGSVLNPTAPTVANPTQVSYLANANGLGPNGTSTAITMTFNVPVYSIEFDFEIFPDGTWNPNNPTQNIPDFEFSATDSSNHTAAMEYNGNMVASPWIVYGVTPGSTDPYLPGNPTTYTHSTVSGTGSAENVPQLIGEATFQFSSSDPATTLTFADWPATVGISNLIINPNGVGPFTSTVPAPSSSLLFGFGALGVIGMMARSRRRKVATA